MSLHDYLDQLWEQGVELWLENGQVRFRGGKEVLTPERMKTLRDNKAELQSLLAEQGDYYTGFPLSEGQRALKLVYDLQPDNVAYNQAFAVRLQAGVDGVALQRAIDYVVERHSMLRVQFWTRNGEPAQRIQESLSLPLEQIDLGAGVEMAPMLATLADRPFDLEQGPLVRFTLLQAGDEASLLLSVHHIIADFWALETLVRELQTAYEAFACGQEPDLPPLALNFKDHVREERKLLEGERGKRQRDYWHDQLQGHLAALDLPTDNPRPPLQTFGGSEHHFHFSPELSAELRAFAKRQQVTPFAVVMAAFQVMMARYSQQEDVLLGVPMACRRQADLQRIVGHFTNPVVMRQTFADGMSFGELLTQVQSGSRAAFEQQEYPLQRLIEALPLSRDLSRPPLVQVLFSWNALRDGEAIGSSHGSLYQEPIFAGQRGSAHDLTFTGVDGAEQIQASLRYNSDLWQLQSIERMAGHLQRLLTAAIESPDADLQQLTMISEPERQQLLHSWNDTAVDYERGVCLHTLFERQVAANPTAEAVRFDKQSLSYDQLNRRVNQLARRLVDAGVGPDSMVAVCLERSLDMMVALMGTVKAGGAYVPMDPSYPPERIAYMLEDSAAPVLLTHANLLQQLPEHQAQVVCLDRDAEALAQLDDSNPNVAVTEDHLAYVIYTSGSTGKPKGVMNQHSGIVNRLFWMQQAYGLDASDTVLQKTTFSFDVSVWEFFWPMMTGARLVFAKPEGHKDNAYLIDLIQREQVTTLHFVPSMLSVMLSSPGFEQCTSLRRVICSGEALTREHEKQFFQQQQAELHNLYGPTEAAIDVSYWACQRDSQLNTVPIGKPIANIQLHVLDQYLCPVPIGVPGELHIGGIGVARGYCNKPEMSAEKFIDDPINPDAGFKLYKTGDLVRWMPDGNIEYLGRIDHQVKLRGFRIELGEIESLIALQDGVRESVVMVKGSGDKARLVAYLVVAADNFDTRALRQALSADLPEFMVPSSYVLLDSMPLTPNGKADRKALPEPDEDDLQLADYVAPRTELEQQLAAIWAEVLGRERIGLHDNFFEVGGDSILSMQIVTRASRAGYPLAPRDVFEYQTVAELAARAQATARDIKAEQGHLTGACPLLPIQHWFFEQTLSQRDYWNQSLLLEIADSWSQPHLETALQALQQQHDALRLRFALRDQHWQAQFDEVPAVHLLHQQVADETELERLTADWQSSLQLDHGRTLVAGLIDFDGRRLLYVSIHHLVVDGVSWRILLADLATAIEQLQAGQSIDLGCKSTDLRHWAAALQQRADSDALQVAKDYWSAQSHLDSWTASAADCREGELLSLERHLDELTTNRLLHEAGRAYRSEVSDLLLAALAQTFVADANGRPLSLTMEGHGREWLADDIDLSRTVGWFTSMYPLALQLPDVELGAQLQSVKEQLRALPMRGLDYGLLRYLHGAGDDLPTPGILFNYLGQLDAGFQDSGIALAADLTAPMRHPSNQAAFPLTIDISVQAGQLHLHWQVAPALAERAEQWLASFHDHLLALLDHCLEQGQIHHTPSDFPLAPLDQSQLQTALAGAADIEDLYPLSPMQEGMLFHTLYEPQSELYFEQFTATLGSDLNVEVFQQALQQVVQSHTILRTSFVYQGLEQPLQRVHSHLSIPWQQHQSQALAAQFQLLPHDTEAVLEAYLARDRQQKFDLAAPPLMRCALIQLSSGHYQWVWSFHHLLLDGWSLPLVMGQLFDTYASLQQQQAPAHATSRYQPFIQHLQQRDNRDDEHYWRHYLAGLSAPTTLPIDKPLRRGEEELGNYERQPLTFDAQLSGELEQFARRHRLTLNTLVQGLWALLLHRYTGESDICFGTTVAGRPAELVDIEESVGLYINTLPLRVICNDDAIVPWLQKLQDQQFQHRQHQLNGLAQVQGWSELPKGQGLFDTLLVFENYPMDEALAAGKLPVSVSDVKLREQTNFPLTVIVHPGQQLQLEISYDEQRFQYRAIERLLQHLLKAAQALAREPELTLDQVPLLSDSERAQLLHDFAGVKPDYPRDASLVELFDEQVQRRPEAVAVTMAYADGSVQEQLTYRVLDSRANRLANYLIQNGVKPAQRVGICVERSIDMVAGLLAIMKCGASFVPLDPSYPVGRLRYMVQDIAASVILVQEELLEQLPIFGDQTVVTFETALAEFERLSEQPPELTALPATSPLYVMYTSGSTGQPKGIEVTHRNVARLVKNTNYAPYGEDQSLLQYAPIAFDAATVEIWGALLNGGRLVVCPPGQLQPNQLGDIIREQQVSILWLTVALFHYIAENNPDIFRGTTQVLTGGDVVSPVLVRKVLKAAPGTIVVNAYGPTENTSFTSCNPIRTEAEVDEPLSIGRPIANSTVYILDKHRQPVPIGVPGELYSGGDGVANGYLNRPEQSAEVFLDDPFSETPNARMYKTGDMARFLEDGRIEFLGRADLQVKIRGYRIELGEIEGALNAHQHLSEACVVVREDLPGQKRLVAYVVVHRGYQIESAELRDYLKGKLPDYMVPGAYVELDALPLSPTGKVDRRALPEPPQGAGRDYQAPESELEQQLAKIWTDVLQLERVGSGDNFFELGGDSILSIQIVSRAAQQGIQLTPKLLFDHQTVAELALAVETEGLTLQAEQGQVSGEVPLTPIQQWFFEQPFVEPQHWNQAVLLEVSDKLPRMVLEQAVAHLERQHDGLRLRYHQDKQGNWQQSHAEGSSLVLEQIDLTGFHGAALTAAVERQADQYQASLNLQDGPLMRLVWMQTAPGSPHRLFLVAHHLVIDGVSWRLVLEDLERICQQLSLNEAVDLGRKTSSFKEWAAALNEFAVTGPVTEQQDYWREQMAQPALQQPLPYDFDGDNLEESLFTVSASLSAGATEQLLTKVNRAYHTEINDILLTALASVIGQWLQRDEMALILEGHGREYIGDGVDVSRTVGWFTSMFPLVLPSEGDAGTRICATKERLRALPQRGLGYGLLRYLAGDQSLVGALPQISFNYLGQLDSSLAESRWFQPAAESMGRFHGAANQRTHALVIDGSVRGGQLTVSWDFSAWQFKAATIQALADQYIEQLQGLIEHCLSVEQPGFTASDFPLAQLEAPQLEQLRDRFPTLESVYPLSPMQEGMLFRAQLQPDAETYFEQLTCDLEGEIDFEAFEKAWQQPVIHHTVLRSAFVHSAVIDGLSRSLQVVLSHWHLPIGQVDFRRYQPSEQERALTTLLAKDRQRGFDLTQQPPLRVLLVRLARRRYRLVWSFHHILLDGWSLPLVLKDVLASYQRLAQGIAPLSQPVDRYQTFIEHLEQRDRPAETSYWRQYLSGFENATHIPWAKAKLPANDTAPVHQKQRICLNRQLTRELQELAQAEHITLNILLQGAWALLLHRYSGESDVMFGVTVSGRPPELADIDRKVGLFINSLPLRVKVEEGRELVSWLGQLQSQQMQQRQFQSSSLIDIQSWSELSPTDSLFDSLLVFENYPLGDAMASPDSLLQASDFGVKEQTEMPLTLLVTPDDELQIDFSYDIAVFDDASIGRMAEHLQQVLQHMVAAPEQTLSELDVLGGAERQLLLQDWNDRGLSYPSDLCLHQLIEQQAQRTPDAAALTCGEQTLSYQQLNQRANQLARYLVEQGIQAESMVGVCLQRQPDLIVALLAIHKAGGAYVPLDPNYPQDRVEYMLSDSCSPLVLTQSSLLSRLPEDDNCQRLAIDQLADTLAGLDGDNLQLPLSSRQLAYVIYTSGSTGLPKGVAIEHRSANCLVHWAQSVFTEHELSGVLASTSICFDLSVFEIFLTLSSGGELILVDNALELPYAPARDRVTLINTVPSAIAALHRDGAIPANVRTINLAGEPLKQSLVDALYLNPGIERVYDLYGPSEDTTYSTYTLREAGGFANVGRPIANTVAYVVDEQLRPVPLGIEGELLLGGDGLARGYLHKPHLTDEKFIPNPFSPELSKRLYRTGDLVRYFDDGRIEYLGRIDHQVKIRGFRIELGEVEARMNAFEQTRESVVVALDDDLGNKYLAAYVVGTEGIELDVSALRNYLAAQLPNYMVPSAFVEMDALPLTPNGKVDKKALPKPAANLLTEKDYLEPRTANEKALAQIWQQVLGVEQVGLHDNFFELGGHSLLATQVVSRIRRELGYELPLKVLFDQPNLEDQAALLDGMQTSTLTAIEVIDRDQLLPLSFAQQRLWFVDQLDPGNSAYNMPAALRLRGGLDVAALANSFDILYQRHESLRTVFRSEAGEAVQVIQPYQSLELSAQPLAAALAELEQYDLSGDFTRQAEKDLDSMAMALAAADSNHAFDLAIGPLFQVRLIELADDDHLLLVNLHHIISDGWSTDRLLAEFFDAMSAAQQGLEAQLPELPIQYADFAYWQRQWLSGDVLAAQVDYWKQQLQGAPSYLNLPTDRPRPPLQSFNGATFRFEVSAELTQQLRQVSQQLGATSFMTGLAAYHLLMGRYARVDDVCVGIPIAGRSREETEGIIGLFVNSLVTRSHVGDNPTFAQLVDDIKAMTIGAYAHQDLPFDMLVDELNVERSLSHTPYLQVAYSLQGGALEETVQQLPGVDVELLPVARETSKYDLTLALNEGEETLIGSVEYATDLFDHSSIERLVQHYLQILQQVLAAPDCQIDRVELLEAQALLDALQLSADDYEVPLPLTATQRDLYLDSVINPDALENSTGTAIDLYFGVDVERWQQVLQQLNDSQSVLRTHIVTSNLPYADIAYQAVRKQQPIDWHYEDLSAANIDYAHLQARIKVLVAQAYDLQNGPLTRHALFKLAEEHYVAVHAAHHMVLDGAGLNGHLKKTCALYEQLSRDSGDSMATTSATADNQDLTLLDQQAFEQIRQALLQQNSVLDAAVRLRETEKGPVLAAYVVSDNLLAGERLRSSLAQQLPEAWLPSLWIPLASLPLTVAGQLDEVALASLALLDDASLLDCEQRLLQLPGIERVAVLTRNEAPAAEPLHLAELLPEQYAQRAGLTSTQLASSNPSSKRQQRPPAYASGGRLLVSEELPKDLVSALQRSATECPDRGITFIRHDGSRDFQSYAELWQEALQVAAGLQANGAEPGSAVLLQLADRREHFASFWGCLMVGVRPVAVAVASSYDRDNAVVNKLYNTWELLKHPRILASEHLREPLAGLQGQLPMADLQVLTIGELRRYAPLTQPRACQPKDVAFMQLTSGSTGAPKCIQETHHGIITHIHAATQFNGYERDDVEVNWLPMDHVVPILTTHLKDTYLGCNQIQVPTELMLAQPLLWLDLIDEFEVTQTWSPNFGFKLVADAVAEALAKEPQKTWDLASIKFFMNAGEQVTMPVVREFLDTLAPFGVERTHMQPAFGMAEVCTCMTYQNQFADDTGIHRVLKHSLAGSLELASADVAEREVIEFVDLGAPVPGIEIRITDDHNRPVSEGVIGRFQIRGAVVTPGYLYNDKANDEAFVGDGWFNSGDLGFILNGRLALTGREKELIIINGANFYCYEIEDVVNQVTGVEPTFVAAVGFDDRNTGTEALAIFFVPSGGDDNWDAELIQSIRTRVTASLGIAPELLIPIGMARFPKTTSGKIQRTSLKNALMDGEFDGQRQAVDRLLHNRNTLPSWFYQPDWQVQARAVQELQALDGTVLILADQKGLAHQLSLVLQQAGAKQVVTAIAGEQLQRLSDDMLHYPAQQPQLLLNEVDNLRSVIDLTSFDDCSDDHAGAESLQQLLHLGQQLAAMSQPPLRLLVVSNHSQVVRDGEAIIPAKGAIPALINNLDQELAETHCRHLDLPLTDLGICAGAVANELTAAGRDRLIALRGHQRYVSVLREAPLQGESELPIKRGASYVITGGLGGLGQLLAEHLLQHYQANLLLLGRSPLDNSDAGREREAALAQLQRLPGDVQYRVADVTEAHAISSAWQALDWPQLDGIFHLAGGYHEANLTDETDAQLARLMAPKEAGSWALLQLLQQHGSADALYVGFSSIYANFGGLGLTAYSCANAFQQAFSHYLKRLGIRSHCLAWSTWDDLGMNRGVQALVKRLTRAKGYYAIDQKQGLSSLLVGLKQTAMPNLLIGLDASKANVAGQLRRDQQQPMQTLQIYYEGSATTDLGTLSDQRGIPVGHVSQRLKALPLTSGGDVDREALIARLRGEGRLLAPRNALEQQLVKLWQGLLAQPQIGINQDFFELGGHSLLALQFVAKVNELFPLNYRLQDLFEAPTVEGLAAYLQERGYQSADDSQIDALVAPVADTDPLADLFAEHVRTEQGFDTRQVRQTWRNRLADVEALDVAPQTLHRPSGEMVYRDLQLSDNHWLAVQRYCREQGISPANYFKCLFALLLKIYARPQADFAIDEIAAGRPQGHEQAVGCYYHQLPFVVPQALMQGDTELVDLFSYARDYRAELGQQHTISIFQQRQLAPLARLSFQFNFFHFDHALNLLGHDCPVQTFSPDVPDMVLLVAQVVDDQLQLKLQFHDDQFQDLGFLTRLLQLSEQVVQGATTVADLQWLERDERQQQLAQWGGAIVPANTLAETLHGQFEIQAAANAERPAVTYEQQSWSYAELNLRANQLAHYLRNRGVGADSLVGLSISRSREMLVAILGILKAGGAYVPIDPASPAERTQFILQDANVELLVSEAELLGQFLPEGESETRGLAIDRDWSMIERMPSDNPVPLAKADNTAYVIYTSGTTGRPKGVPITHANAVRLFSSTQPWFNFSEDDVWTLFHSFAFDFSVWEIWGPLLFGGRLVVVPQMVTRSTEEFYQLLVREQVTFLNQTPSAFTQLIQMDQQQRGDLALRTVVFGGEALDFAALEGWVQRHSLEQVQLINMYGITETTVHVTYHRITDADLQWRASNVGRPIPDLRTYILDANGQLLPPGVAGELFVSGAGLSPGYLGRDDLTIERFIPTTLADQPADHQRLYKTGDLARYLPSGDIEYLGRIDLQVKIRGHRIELGEIEAQLNGLDRVREAVVIAREDSPGDRRLVAYVVSAGEALSVNELREALQLQLPSYMIPAAFVMLDQLPLTANGKVDKKALPEPSGEVALGSEYVAPRNSTEEVLVGIWQEVLNVEVVGIRDNFFALGGHSLLGTQMVARMEEALGVAVPLRQLFETPTVEEIALAILEHEVADVDDDLMAQLLAELDDEDLEE